MVTPASYEIQLDLGLDVLVLKAFGLAGAEVTADLTTIKRLLRAQEAPFYVRTFRQGAGVYTADIALTCDESGAELPSVVLDKTAGGWLSSYLVLRGWGFPL